MRAGNSRRAEQALRELPSAISDPARRCGRMFDSASIDADTAHFPPRPGLRHLRRANRADRRSPEQSFPLAHENETGWLRQNDERTAISSVVRIDASHTAMEFDGRPLVSRHWCSDSE